MVAAADEVGRPLTADQAWGGRAPARGGRGEATIEKRSNMIGKALGGGNVGGDGRYSGGARLTAGRS
jgi:hypothetical protein